MELLAPAGNREKLNIALHFGADAVYLGGKDFSLRAYSDNFDAQELEDAVNYTHALGKKAYVTLNIFPLNKDFGKIEEYLRYLEEIGADAAIVTDAGVLALAQKVAPNLPLHLSTQANTTNGYAAQFWADMGVSRIVLARELSLEDIKGIRDMLPNRIQLECFVHGAMCISYSGRCLLSSYLSDRDSNRGECVQACRWKYQLIEANRKGQNLTIMEDERGTYIMNSRDLNMIAHIDKLSAAGVHSLKIEGRMKSVYYVANVVNAYRRAIAVKENNPKEQIPQSLIDELWKSSNRGYTTGFYLGKNKDTVSYNTSQSQGEYEFIAQVRGYEEQKGLLVEQRNRFRLGDRLEILSNGKDFNKTIVVEEIYDQEGNVVADAKIVQQLLYIKTDKKLSKNDLLRRKNNGN